MAHCPNCENFIVECNPDMEDFDKPCPYYKSIYRESEPCPRCGNPIYPDSPCENCATDTREKEDLVRMDRGKLDMG